MELPAGNWPIRSILTPFFRPQWSHRKLGSLGYEPVDTTKYIEELRAKNARTEALREEVAANRRKLIQEQQAKYAKFRSPAAVPPAPKLVGVWSHVGLATQRHKRPQSSTATPAPRHHALCRARGPVLDRSGPSHLGLRPGRHHQASTP